MSTKKLERQLFSVIYEEPTSVPGNKNVERALKPGSYTIYPIKTLDELPEDEGKNETTYRFTVTGNGEFRIAREGTPNSTIPAHCQMSHDKATKETARAVAAGNIRLKNRNKNLDIKREITLINHKSSDHQNEFNSLQWPLAILIVNQVPFAENFVIERLNSSGRKEAEYRPSLQALRIELLPLLSKFGEEFIRQNQHDRVYVFESSGVSHARLPEITRSGAQAPISSAPFLNRHPVEETPFKPKRPSFQHDHAGSSPMSYRLGLAVEHSLADTTKKLSFDLDGGDESDSDNDSFIQTKSF